MFSYRNRAGYLWQLSNLVSFSLSLKSSSTTTYCSAKWLALQITVVIWEQFQTHPLITFVYLNFLFSFLEPNNRGGFFTRTVPSTTGPRYLSRLHTRAASKTGFYNSTNSKGWGALFILGVILSYQDCHREERPAWHSLPALQKQDPTDLKYSKQRWHTQVTAKLLLFRSAEVLFFPSSPELRKCFMNAKVRRKLKDIIHTCISNTHDSMYFVFLNFSSLQCKKPSSHC